MKTLRVLFNACLLIIFTSAVCAEMYRHTDADGVTTFSDKEVPGATLILPRPGNTVTMPKYTAKKSKDKPADTSYSLFTIDSPENDTTLNDNTGSIPVTMTLTPELNVTAGHSITVYLNDQIVSENSTTLSANIENIERGSHNLYAVVYDTDKKSLIHSNGVSLHIKRFSSLH